MSTAYSLNSIATRLHTWLIIWEPDKAMLIKLSVLRLEIFQILSASQPGKKHR